MALFGIRLAGVLKALLEPAMPNMQRLSTLWLPPLEHPPVTTYMYLYNRLPTCDMGRS